MSMFKNLTSSNELESQGDSLGGGIRVRESGLYEATVKVAYVGESSGGAMSVTTVYELADGGEFRDTQYVTTSREKGQRNYYEKDGKKLPLLGYTIINDLCMLTTEQELADQDTVEKHIKIYDFDAKKEVPTAVQCIDALEGQKVWLGLVKIRSNKQKKGDDGKYYDTSEERFTNEINKIFHYDTKLTLTEAINGQTEGTFHQGWLDRWEGKVQDKFKEVEEGARQGAPRRTTAAPQAGAPTKTSGGLFSKR